ncbi:uncharacterized protein METZ01_LOCUS306651, partial [marine metagenome]
TTKINRQRIKNIYNKPSISNSDLNTILNIMDETKSKKYCAELAKKYCVEALSSIKNIPMAHQSRKDIESIALFLTNRQH